MQTRTVTLRAVAQPALKINRGLVTTHPGKYFVQRETPLSCPFSPPAAWNVDTMAIAQASTVD